MEEQALGAKRHSRSFSEPNLAAKVIKQQLLQAVAPPAAQDHSSEEDEAYTSYRVSLCNCLAAELEVDSSVKTLR